jgi:hypothetical protein
MNENRTAQFSATAWFSDGSSQMVSSTWTEDSAATTISIYGLLSAGEVASDAAVTVSASYTVGGITRNATKSVTVVNGTRIISLGGNLAFGNVAVGSSAQRSLTITNTGNAALTVRELTYPSGFTGNWSGAIGAGSSQNVTVTFTPGAVTTYSGNLTVNSDALSGTSTRAVSGTGTGGPTPGISVTPTSNHFGAILVGTTTSRTFYVTNTGTGTLVGTSTVAAPFSIVGTSNYSLTAGAGQAVVVRYSPMSTGNHSNAVTFTRAGGTSVVRSVKGSGVRLPRPLSWERILRVRVTGRVSMGRLAT